MAPPWLEAISRSELASLLGAPGSCLRSPIVFPLLAMAI